jgi:ectoine hydroxylase-related dioxygenase (phytanoyl-CoA dioxygenase family)
MQRAHAAITDLPGHDVVDPWTDATPWLGAPAILRAQARRDGVLYFRNLVPPEAIARLRSDAAAVCRAHGLAVPGAGPIRATAATPVVERSPAWWKFHADVLRLRALYALPWAPALTQVMEAILGEEVFPHSCSIFRAIPPGDSTTPKPAHQDVRYVGGGDSTWTVWIPCDACPREVGGIEVLSGSHRLGVLPVRPAGEGHEVVYPPELRWVGGDMQAGDAVVFSTMTVHRGLPNQTRDRLRLSADYRFQKRSAPVRLDALLPYLRFLTWAEVYRDWPADDPLQYYWRPLGLTYATD